MSRVYTENDYLSRKKTRKRATIKPTRAIRPRETRETPTVAVHIAAQRILQSIADPHETREDPRRPRKNTQVCLPESPSGRRARSCRARSESRSPSKNAERSGRPRAGHAQQPGGCQNFDGVNFLSECRFFDRVGFLTWRFKGRCQNLDGPALERAPCQ